MPGFMEGFANATAGNDIVQQGIDRGRQSKLAQLAAQYAQGGAPDYQGIAANGGDPLRFRDDQQNQKQARVKELSQYAGYLASLPAQARPQAYAALMPKLAPIGQELGLPPLPAAWDESHIEELQALAQLGQSQQANTGIQSTFIDAQGNRVGVTRDGRTMVLGQNAPNTQIIEGQGGFFGVDKGNLQAKPVMMGGPQAPQAPAPGTNDGVISVANQMAAAGIPPQYIEQWMAKQPGIGPAAQPQAPGAQLQPAPKPVADKGTFATLTPAEVKALGLPDGTIAQRSPDGKVDIVNKPRDLPSGGQVIENPDGSTTFIPGGKLSDAQRNNAGFYDRMVNASKELNKLEAQGYDPTNIRDYMTVGGKVLNGLSSPEGQQYHQAAQNWVRANLRKESGAAIGVQEMDQEIRNYFPVFGDSPEVIKQKADNRRVVENAMRQAAGGAVPTPGQRPAPKAPAAGGWSIQKVSP